MTLKLDHLPRSGEISIFLCRVTSLREAARCGLGLTVLPNWLIEDDLREGTLVRVLPKWKAPDLPVHVVYAGHRLLPLRVSAFIDFAVKHLAANGDCGIKEADAGN